MIEIKNLFKSFEDRPVLNGVNLKIEKGLITVVLGVSGGGKSVLLKHLIGLLRPDQGEILVDGIDLIPLTEVEFNAMLRRFAVLFQGGALFDSMTLFENVAFPMRERLGLKGFEIPKRVESLLRQVGLPNIGWKMPDQLSGGMRKRVALARALALTPEYIFYDEPTTGLDPITSDAIANLIVKTHRENRLTSFIISHNINEIFKMADRLALLHNGVVAAYGTVSEFQQSKDPLVRQFLEGRSEGPIQIME
ncbi:MAG: ABC transporter ATP-binding protein [Deltaproteobacteria bacterium]|nr:ABC transporter ATP-binding protein [Deltaproteobacteria bacterium]